MSFRTPILLLLLAACTLRPYEYGASATDATTTDTTTTTTTAATAFPVTGATTTTSTGPVIPGTSTSGPDDPATTTTTASNFLPAPDSGIGIECDQWVQDCPEGQKCMPYSADGDAVWESLKCVNIVPNPAGLYEPCMAGPVDTGEDTCDEGLMCWDVIDGMGQCVGMCIGSEAEPDCADPASGCTLSGDGALTICLPPCDPLAQDCLGGDLCITDLQDTNAWTCMFDASGDEGQVFDPCEYLNTCDLGLLCSDPTLASECDPMALGCCLPLCDTTLPNTCPGQAQECLPWYEPGMAPPGYENVGLCGLPMP